MALFFFDELQMLAVIAGGYDEVLHFLTGNGQWWIVMFLIVLEMIQVER